VHIKKVNIEEYKSIFEKLQKRLQPKIFNSPEWLSIYDSRLNINVIFNKDNHPIGVFNTYSTKKGFFSHLNTPPFSPDCSLVFENVANNLAKQNSFYKKIFSLLEEYLSSQKASITTLCFPDEFHDFLPFYWNGYKISPLLTYHLNLNESADTIHKNLASERRNDIKKAEKDGLVSIKTDDYSIIKKMVEFTYARKDKKVNTQIVDGILKKFATPQNSYCFITFQDETPIAGAFVVYHKDIAYYLLGGYDPNHRHQGAGALSVWNALLHAKELGLKTFDFEGSVLPEVEKFFRAFGGYSVPYLSINKASLPVEIMLKFVKRNIF